MVKIILSIISILYVTAFVYYYKKYRSPRNSNYSHDVIVHITEKIEHEYIKQESHVQ